MSREHMVETLQWDVAFASEQEAFEWQPRLASLIRGSAVDVIAEVFDELGGAHDVLALDTLHIDLGRLPRTGFDAQLRDRLRARLREALEHELGALCTGALAGPAALKAAGTSRVDYLKQYLVRGFLPWQAGAGTRRRLDQLAERLACDSGPELAEWLQGAPVAAGLRLASLLRQQIAMMKRRLESALLADGPIDGAARQAWAQLLLWDAPWLVERVGHHGQAARVREHMARHFGHALLLELVALLVPTERDFIEAVVGQAAWIGEAMDPPVTAPQMQPRLWEYTLAYLLLERGSDFNRRSYIGSLLRRSARQDGLEYGQLVHALMRSLDQAGEAGGLQWQMLSLLQALAEDAGTQDTQHADEEAASWQLIEGYDREPGQGAVALGWMKLRIESALLADGGIDTPAKQAWAQLLLSDADWLVQQVGQHGQAAPVRQRMVHGFSEQMLLELVSLLVPTERDFIQAVVSQPALFGEAMDPPVPAPQMRPRLWEFTLAYLLVERGSDFNRRSYIGSLLRQAARREDLAYVQLLQALVGSVGASGAPSGLQREMLQLLLALQGDAVPAAPAAAGRRAAPGSRRWREIELPRLRFDWQAALASAALDSASARQVWRELEQHDRDWLLDATCRHAQSERARRQLAQGLPQPLLVEWLDLMAPGAGRFIEAVVVHAAQLAQPGAAPAARLRLWEFSLAWLLAERGSEFNKRSYMGAVLRRMARDEGTDPRELLRALAAGLQAAHLDSAMQQQMLRLAGELMAQLGEPLDRDLSVPGHGLERLAAALRHGFVLPATGATAWVEHSEAWLRSAGGPGRAALEQALRSPQAAARLVALLPPRLLTRVVFILRRPEHAALQQCADLLAAACAAAGGLALRARVEELKWQFIFRYLFVQGRTFSVADFTRRMADWLAASLRPDQPLRWRQALAREVARGGKTAGQALAHAMAQSLKARQPVAVKAKPASPPAVRPRREGAAPAEPAADEPIYIANAGLVLAEPFLPHLLRMRGLVEGNGFEDPVAAAKAAHLLQAVALGAGEWPEHHLVLNKLLCGLPIADALAWEGPLEAEDLATADDMLHAMLQQWKVLGGTTAQGLRETFLRREGRLVRKADHWQLLVEPGPFDMLIDQLPWGFSTIRYPWMERMIHVQWR